MSPSAVPPWGAGMGGGGEEDDEKKKKKPKEEFVYVNH